MATRVHTPNRPAGLNRALLTVIGLLVLLAGAYVLLRGLGVLARVGVPVAVGDPTAPLLPAGLAIAGWEPWVAAAAAVIVGLGCLRWLAAQAQRRVTGGTWQLPAGAHHGVTTLDTSAATAALTEELTAYPGISAATATLTGARTEPELHLVITVEDQAPLHTIRERVDTEALPRLRHALELPALPTLVLVRAGAKPAARSVV